MRHTQVVVAIEWACYGKAASPRVLASIAVLLTGITLATVTDSQVASRPLGVVVASVNVVVTGLYQVRWRTGCRSSQQLLLLVVVLLL